MISQNQDPIELKKISKEIVTELERISNSAKDHPQPVMHTNVFACGNTMVDTNAINTLSRIKTEEFQSIRRLINEPAIARLTVSHVKNSQYKKTYYITRNYSSEKLNVISYRSHLGSLLAYDFEETVTTPGGDEFEAIEKITLSPEHSLLGWDSQNSVFMYPAVQDFTIKSLRSLLDQFKALPQKTIEDFLKEEELAAQRTHRSILTQMELRNQPILDKAQDHIFRLPIDTKIILLGAPGTGKTTTLIKRVGLKLDEAHLEERELKIINEANDSSATDHRRSWIMFTPTELLRLYVKEAFSIEDIPAPDDHIRTWHDYVRELNRDTTRILKSTNNKKGFTLTDATHHVNEESANAITWFNDFETYQKNIFLSEILDNAAQLTKSDDAEMQRFGHAIENTTLNYESNDLTDFFIAIFNITKQVEPSAQSLNDVIASNLNSAINLKWNNEKEFGENLRSFISSLKSPDDAAEDDDDEIDDDDDASSTQLLPRKQAISQYRKALRIHARATATGRKKSKSSISYRIIEWAQNIYLTNAELKALGQAVATMSALNMIRRCTTRYFRGLPSRYRSYRKQRLQSGNWPSPGDVPPNRISFFELDILTLSYLTTAHALLSRHSIRKSISDKFWSELDRILGKYKNQVLVDEAADFSPLQIACMNRLTHPAISSFFASGDLNQRVTANGIRSIDDFIWAVPNALQHNTPYVYRQTTKLFEFTNTLLQCMGQKSINAKTAPTTSNDAISPSLCENCNDLLSSATWISNRIIEIENFLGILPSIAVFANSEESIREISLHLKNLLQDENITVEACPDGNVKGQKSAVRVFDIKHIKGLEFEASFFAEIDEIAKSHEGLVDKYLYVGSTRAATHLGITCKSSLPLQLIPLREMCVDSWSI